MAPYGFLDLVQQQYCRSGSSNQSSYVDWEEALPFICKCFCSQCFCFGVFGVAPAKFQQVPACGCSKRFCRQGHVLKFPHIKAFQKGLDFEQGALKKGYPFFLTFFWEFTVLLFWEPPQRSTTTAAKVPRAD